jgi:mannose/fructose/N-acetylgalactosamine-specific phosphotransferase system component IID
MQGMGFLFTLISGAEKNQRDKIRKTHKGFFNTHPYMSSYIIGATIRAYDEGKSSPEKIKRFITITQTSFASAGDILFWQTIRPALLLMAAILSIKLGIIGPIIFIVVYNIFHLYHRIKGIVIYLLKSKRFTKVQHIFEILGAFFCGLLISLAALKINYLLLIPLTLLFTVLLIKRFWSVLIIITVILLIIIMVMV